MAELHACDLMYCIGQCRQSMDLFYLKALEEDRWPYNMSEVQDCLGELVACWNKIKKGTNTPADTDTRKGGDCTEHGVEQTAFPA